MEIKINGTWKRKINIINNSINEVTWKRNAKGSFMCQGFGQPLIPLTTKMGEILSQTIRKKKKLLYKVL